MEYAVYVAVPSGDDCGLIARAATAKAPNELAFSVRGKGDPSASSDVELCFRIRGVSDQEEAMSRALHIYAVGRREAGLRLDAAPRASFGID